MDKKKDNMNKRALKAGIWYTVCNVLIKGVNFSTTPIFTRLMSKREYGDFANYSSWLSLLTTLVTLDLYVSISRAKLDYAEDLNGYISSIQFLGSIFTGICYLVVCIFHNYFVVFFDLDMSYIHIMFIYMMVSPAFQILQTKEQQMMKYKKVVFLTIISTGCTIVLSLLLVLVMNNRFLGRVLGNTAVLFLVSAIIYIYNSYKGKQWLNTAYWKYALMMSIPFIPHILAGNILGTIDRIFIKKYCGAGETAIYSVVYTCSLLVTMIASSINQAWSPWLFTNLRKENYCEIRLATEKYLKLALLGVFILILLGPEFLLFFGGKQYMSGKTLIPVIMAGCFFVILYTFFINIEIYHKRTGVISLMTVISAGFNMVTNWLLVPVYGYQAAAYTTLASYLLLFVLHFFASRNLEIKRFYSSSFFFGLAFLMVIIIWVSKILYLLNLVRWLLAFALTVVMVFRNYRIFVTMIKEKRGN